MLLKYQRLMVLANPYLNTRKNDVHIPISLDYASRMIAPECGDEEIVIPAVILHDVGWCTVPEDLQLKAFGPGADPDLNRIHEVEGVKIAGAILAQVGFDQNRVKEILDIVGGHDSRLNAISINDAIVKDADKLFRYSPAGFAIDSERFNVHAAQRLVLLRGKIEEWFLTKTGKELAWEAVEYLELVCGESEHA